MWIGFALGSAFFIALQGVFIKKSAVHFNEYIITWAIIAISSLFFIPILFFAPIPHLSSIFWIAVVVRMIIDSIGLIYYVKGLKIAPLSLAIPLIALVPLVILVASYFINHLFPTTLGILGVMVTIAGLYFLNFDHDTKHLLSPLYALRKNRGLQYVLIFVVSQGLITSLQKLAIDNSNPYFYTASFQLIWALCFTPIAFFVNKKEFKSIFTTSNLKRLFPVGGFDAIQVLLYSIGISLALPVYMTAVQNISILLTSFFSWIFFKEKIVNHIIPTIVIILGVIILAFAQK